MRKTLTYSSFAIASILVILAFITAKGYVQLGVAILLYPALAYFALKIFPRKSWKAPVVTVKLPVLPVRKNETGTVHAKGNKVEVADVDKRTFLKIIGAAGLSFFIFSILGRRVESLLFDRALDSGGGAGGSTNNAGALPDVSPTSGYRISEIDDGETTYYGFTNKDGAWFIMREDAQTSSFRYAKGNTLFSNNWVNRKNLKYDYYHNLF